MEKNLDRDWADKTLSQMNAPALANFLLDNPSPVLDIAIWCSDDKISAFFEALLLGCFEEEESISCELIETALSGFIFRYRPPELAGIDVPTKSIAENVVKALKSFAKRTDCNAS